jgi:hypothetical protein
MYIDSVRTSQGTHYVSAAKMNWLMLFKEKIAFCFEHHTKRKFCGQNLELQKTLKQMVYVVTTGI